MSHSNRMKSSDHRKKQRRGTKTHHYTRLNEYVEGVRNRQSDFRRERDLARSIGEFGGAPARIDAARALIDIVARHGTSIGEESVMLMIEAGQLANHAAQESFPGTLPGIASKKLMREIPIRLQISEGTLPNLDSLKKYHQGNLDAIPELLDGWKNVSYQRRMNKTGSIEDKKNYVGVLSEFAVEALLSRCAIREMGEGWVPIKSTLSEDRGIIHNATYKTGWNISVYADYMGTDDPLHKLQVKTRPSEDDSLYIDPEINLVHVSDLRMHFFPDQVVHPEHILRELQQEQVGSMPGSKRKDPTYMLDARTKPLLDMFS